jgi:hypothetical protein
VSRERLSEASIEQERESKRCAGEPSRLAQIREKGFYQRGESSPRRREKKSPWVNGERKEKADVTGTGSREKREIGTEKEGGSILDFL